MTTFASLSKQTWPHEGTPGELDSFFGNPRGPGGRSSPQWEAENLTTIICPWKLSGGVAYIRCHRKVAQSLLRILTAIWEFYGHDQAKIDAASLNDYGGMFNYRPNVNAPSRLSVHSYGAAIDLSPSKNPNGKAWKDDGIMLPRPVIDAFLQEGWSWGGDFSSTKDPMHFQATFNTHGDAPQDQPHAISLPVQTDVPAVKLDQFRQFILSESGVHDDVAAFKSAAIKNISAIAQNLTSLAEVIKAFEINPKAPLPPPATSAAPIGITVTGTMFGGPGDEQSVAYFDVPSGWANRYGVALPYHFFGPRPKVIVQANGKSVTCEIVDVGPWNTNDPYWSTNSRPQAESGTDMRGRKTNGAGIDLTPAAARALGIDGKGVVTWSFATTSTTGGTKVTDSSTAPNVTVPVGSALGSKINVTNGVALVATVLALVSGGKIGLTPDQQAVIVGVIGALTSVATILFRTFGTTKILPQSLPK